MLSSPILACSSSAASADVLVRRHQHAQWSAEMPGPACQRQRQQVDAGRSAGAHVQRMFARGPDVHGGVRGAVERLASEPVLRERLGQVVSGLKLPHPLEHVAGWRTEGSGIQVDRPVGKVFVAEGFPVGCRGPGLRAGGLFATGSRQRDDPAR